MSWSLIIFLLTSFIPLQLGQTKGAIDIAQLPELIASYSKVIQETSLPSPLPENQRLLQIAHMGADFKSYPKTLPISKVDKKYRLPIVMMQNAFNENIIDGIEVDLQYLEHKDLQEKIFIIHDPLPLVKLDKSGKYSGKYLDKYDAPNLSFLSQDSLKQFIQSYAQQSYYKQHKKIYFELKKQDPKIRPLYISHIVELLSSSELREREDYLDILRELNFISFDINLLSDIYKELPDDLKSSFHFYLIVTSNYRLVVPFLKNVVKMPALDDEYEQTLIHADWLSGVWMDPALIENLPSTLTRWNTTRPTPIPFQYFLATYTQSYKSWEKDIRKQTQKMPLPPIMGLVHDVKRAL